jgi:methyl-accepting chemotaxis protein
MQDPLLTVFVGIIAAAVVVQGVALVLVTLGLRRLAAHVDGTCKDLMKRVDAIGQKADEMFATVKAVAAGAEAIRDNLVNSTSMIRSRVADVDAFLEEVTRNARLQVATAQDFLETSARKIEETFDLVQQNVLTPIREIGALIAGFRVGLEVLTGRRRRIVDPYRHDDEMFV